MAISLKPQHLNRYRQIAWLLVKYGRSDLVKQSGLEETLEAEQRLPRHAYIPFGGGQRICIGNSFALMEGHLVLATLAQHVNFALVPGQRVELEPIVTLRPKNGIKMKVTHRF